MRSASPLRLAPGQSRPLALEIATSEKFSSDVLVEVLYTAEHSPAVFRIEGVRHVFSRRTLTQPQKITYLHPGGVVSYAILRPPSNKALHKSGPDTKLPVVLGLHGAGVETDSDLVRHSFAGAPDLRAWVLFPSGVTPWSGDDWRR